MWLFVPGIFWANFFILLLQMFGWLSNPFVTLVYMMEQAEIFLFGGTARASDIRILFSLIVNGALVAVFTNSDVASDASLTVVYAGMAFITSKNYMHTLGLKQPYKIDNEDMARQRTHAEVIFANLEAT